jgi:predicted ABC-type ATPase
MQNLPIFFTVILNILRMESCKRMLVLVGLPGSGKSTFAMKLAATKPEWKRVNQDDLGSRRACEHAAKGYIAKVQITTIGYHYYLCIISIVK